MTTLIYTCIHVYVLYDKRDRVVKSVDISFDHLTAVSGVGSSPTRDTCDKPSSACGCVRSFFSGFYRLRPTY